MKAMILAAGLGTRLRPLSYELPKPMMPVLGEPLIVHSLLLLKKAGIKEVVINLHYLPQAIKQHLGSGKKWGFKIHYSFEPVILGSGGGLKKAERYFSKEPFFLINGDILIDIDLKKVLAFHRKKKAFATMVLRKDRNQKKYGTIAVDRTGRIRQFLGKPELRLKTLSEYMFTGVHVLEPEILRYLPKGEFSNINRIAYPMLIQDKPIYGYPFRGLWRECGNPEDYFATNQELLGKNGTNAHIRFPKSNIVPPVHVGRDCVLEPGSTVGPNVIMGDCCRIGKNASIRNAVLWDGIQVKAKQNLDSIVLGKKKKAKIKI